MRILFITSNRLGDAVLSTGLLGHLVDHYPTARLTIACGPLAAPLFRAVPGLDRIIPLSKQKWAGHWLDLWRTTFGPVWDLVVDLRNSAVSRLVLRRRLALLQGTGPSRHRVAHIATALKLAPPPQPRLWLGEAERALARRLMPAAGPILAVAPVANWPGKTWRIERFAATVDALTGPGGILPGAPIAVLGTAGERPQAEALLAAIPGDRLIDLMGRLDPLEAGACLSQASLFVGNDSGLMHLAAAAGIPTLGLFGPSRPELYAPWGRLAAVAAVPYHEAVAQPGFDFEVSGPSWMDGLSVATVVAAAEALWARVQAERTP